MKAEKFSNIAFSICIALIFLIYISALPPAIMDFLLVANFSFSLLLLFISFNLEKSSQFTIFPSLLLLSTLFRLGLNLSTTRLILTRAPEAGIYAAGEVIAGFASFVAANNVLVGLLLFLLILSVQFFVVAKGADRISEVVARFMLDGLPGKQIAVDSDLSAGLLDENQVRKMRQNILDESYFYASMDGAMKFLKGDVIASLCITTINIGGGIAMGILYYGMDLGTSLYVFCLLTIGDGLVSILPAFFTAVAAATVLSRLVCRQPTSSAIVSQLLASDLPFLGACASLLLLMVTPLPKIPLLSAAGGMGLLALWVHRRSIPKMENDSFEKAKQGIENLTKMEVVGIEIGYELIKLVDRQRGGKLPDLIMGVRKKLAEEIGVIIPPVNIRDNIKLPSKKYKIFVRGLSVAEGKIYRNRVLALKSRENLPPLDGIPTHEPTAHLKAYWIEASVREEVEAKGYQILEPSAVLALHFREVCLEHINRILSHQEVLEILARAKKTIPDLIKELIPKKISISKLKAILQELLIEQIPIHDMETILEISSENTHLPPEIVAEKIRQRLIHNIAQKYLAYDGNLRTIHLTPPLENYLSQNINRSSLWEKEFVQLIRKKLTSLQHNGPICLLLQKSNLRRFLAQMLHRSKLRIPVFVQNELTKNIQYRILETLSHHEFLFFSKNSKHFRR
ncbi:MAG: flagellar type III secretion system protein FlhA [Planctomycetota bacterium]|nr:MAG: flagellar type III secretion system protein FlhA [Planctomycetota bacterium]